MAEKDLGVNFRTGQAINPVERGHIAFRTDDIDAFKRRLKEKGIPYSDFGTWAMKGWEQIFFYDPDLFWNASSSDTQAKIQPGPNSPVGNVWIGLSKEHYGIHGTPEPSLVGHAQSHGCIRLTNWDASELAQIVRQGTPTILKE